ncbi:DUF6962 family protein [Gracilimonas mengyeensis]|uniref:Uncharacterized protein n=1 Tax=Gracilimonas mengyeensis TaxID=1302730 RepID=A0A521CNV7_9BACT|nr:hypothetical protein [Gracilimonas mengyeensis]SMO61126.1 hypothetical protein SAMN06265219_10632 [Gracilimonas mengyeensis]
MQSASGQPSIEIFELTIMEPMVTFTDLWITAVCLYAFYKLKKLNKKGKVHQYMRWYFSIMAVATFLGGVLGHAFQYAVGLEWKLPGWLISMLAVMAVERASIMHAQPVINDKFGKFLEVANVVELLTFAVITFTTLNFFFIQVHSAYGLGLIVLPLHFLVYWRTRNEGSRIFFLTVIFATLAAFFYTSEIGLHKWFNHLDLAHTVMAISMYCFYRGARQLEVLKPEDIKEDKGAFGDAVKEAIKGTAWWKKLVG